MQPQLIDIDVAFVFELVRPLATVLVLGVLPFGPHASFEEVVIGLEGEVGNRRDVVLRGPVSVTVKIYGKVRDGKGGKGRSEKHT